MCLDGDGILLVADDDQDDQLLLGEVLSDACPKIRAKFVDNGVELMSWLQRCLGVGRLPRLVLMDLNMPRKDGRTALREIRADPDLAHLPVVILTTSSAEEDEAACRLAGADGYYRKPGNLIEFERILGSLCQTYF